MAHPWRPGRSVDCFVSYRSDAQEHARDVAAWLEAAGWTTVMQTFDFLPDDDFAPLIDAALSACHRLVALITPSYFASVWCRDEWQEAVLARKLITVQVQPCGLTGPMATSIDVDLVGLDAATAQGVLTSAMPRLMTDLRPAARISSAAERAEAQEHSPWVAKAYDWNHPQLRPRPDDVTANSSYEARASRSAGSNAETTDR
jgi:hypothetical protein